MSMLRYKVVVLDPDEIAGEVLDEGMVARDKAKAHIADSMDAWLETAANKHDQPMLEITMEPTDG